jgi:hypothetical protein
MRVREGDLLLLATDGLFDNLFQEEILSLVKTFARNNPKTQTSATKLAHLIGETAYNKSKKSHVRTPFSIKKAQYIAEQVKLARESNNQSKQDSLLSNIQQMAEQEGIDQTGLSLDSNFENMCYGRGKTDDITVSAQWISLKHSHSSSNNYLLH